MERTKEGKPGMNGRVGKKVRQVVKRSWREFYADIMVQPFRVRLGIAWYIIRHRGKR